MDQINKLVADYVMLRNRKAALEAEHKEKLSKIKKVMDAIEAKSLAYCNQLGVSSFRTPSGTMYRSEQVSVTVADRDAFVEFLQGLDDEDRYAFIESRANKGAVEAYLESVGELPPGVSVTKRAVVRFNKS
jgi:hypothetical protein